jgi:hypothetical protein
MLYSGNYHTSVKSGTHVTFLYDQYKISSKYGKVSYKCNSQWKSRILNLDELYRNMELYINTFPYFGDIGHGS